MHECNPDHHEGSVSDALSKRLNKFSKGVGHQPLAIRVYHEGERVDSGDTLLNSESVKAGRGLGSTIR